MKRFLFIASILIYAQFGTAQQVVHFGKNVVATPVPTSQTVNISLTMTGNSAPTPISGKVWNSFLYDLGTTQAMLNDAGASSGFSIAVDPSSNGVAYENVGTSFSSTHFPATVVQNQLFGAFPNELSISFAITGLNPAKTYTFYVACYDNSSNSITSPVTVARTTQNISSDNSTVGEGTFLSVTPDGTGKVIVTLGAVTSTFTAINGIIIVGKVKVPVCPVIPLPRMENAYMDYKKVV